MVCSELAEFVFTAKWEYWLTEIFVVVGVWILACVMLLPVCMLVGCCCTNADLSATMPWALAEGEVRIRAKPRSNERENEVTEIEWIKPVKPAISFGEIPVAWVSAVFFALAFGIFGSSHHVVSIYCIGEAFFCLLPH